MGRLTRHQNHVSPIFPPPPPFPSPPPTSWISCSSCPSHSWWGRSDSTFTSLCCLTSGHRVWTLALLWWFSSDRKASADHSSLLPRGGPLAGGSCCRQAQPLH